MQHWLLTFHFLPLNRLATNLLATAPNRVSLSIRCICLQALANNFSKVYQLDKRLEDRLVRLLTDQIAEIDKVDGLSHEHEDDQDDEADYESMPEQGSYADSHVNEHVAALNALDHSLDSGSSFDGSPARPIHIH
jgi:hypothetical protein